MKHQIRKHIGGAVALAVMGITLPTGSRANGALQTSAAVEQGEFVHAVLFLGILVALVGVNRLVKKSS